MRTREAVARFRSNKVDVDSGFEDLVDDGAPPTLRELLEFRRIDEARHDFNAFRRVIHPTMKWGWWVQEIGEHFQDFYDDFEAGRRPWLAIEAPPQHGKSSAATDFIAWVSGKNPNLKTIFASYSDDLGVRTNLELQRIMQSEVYLLMFPDTIIGEHGWLRNTSLFEFVDKVGSFRNTTVNGPINGMELNLGVIDDPVKGRQEASSKTTRDRTWSWFTDDYLGRFSAYSALLIIMTRWHVDDPLGRLRAKHSKMKVLSYAAIAEKDEEYRDEGEALFPELKDLDFLTERKQVLSRSSWESLYQNHPITVGGGQLPIEKFGIMPYWTSRDPEIIASVRFWDKAGSTQKGSSWTAGVLLHRMRDGKFVISHAVHGQWLSSEREQRIKFWAQQDSKQYANYEVGVEQEPGSGGKESAENTVRNLAGFRVFMDKVTGSKEVRAQPFAAQVQHGNVWLVAGDWCTDFLDECEVWPQGRMDQVDACTGAFNHMIKATAFDSSFSWV